MAYAFTSDIDPNARKAPEGERNIPFRSLKRQISSGDALKETAWYGPEGGRESFAIAVSGGAAYGVLLGDFIFIGFRGTTNVADWSINLFWLGARGVLKCPLETELYAYRDHHLGRYTKQVDAELHAGFYRVSQALRKPLHFELEKLQEVYRKRSGPGNNSYPRIVLTGHSLGGALALLSGLHLRHDSIYTFGMPKVCESGLLQELPPRHYRYILEGDPVPRLPLDSMGFRHDIPSLKLDPYRGLPKPGFVSKAISGFRKGVTLSGSMGAAARAVLATEHDMELYVETVMSQ